MSGDKASILDFIREKEKKERAARRKKLLFAFGGVALVALILTGIGMKTAGREQWEVYSLSQLTEQNVKTIFEENKEGFLVKDSLSGRIDTLRKMEDYLLLVSAIRDQVSFGEINENAEYADSLNSTFEPEIHLQQAAVQPEKEIDDSVPLTVADIMPGYPGGETALFRFLSDKLRYPVPATQNQVEGKVFVRFVIERDGTIADATVIKGIGYGCDEEALRVVNLMPAWMPGEINGKKVRMYSSLAVNFKFL
ncbi:MAG: energy transducer TonB [Bacteroidia bacterium]